MAPAAPAWPTPSARRRPDHLSEREIERRSRTAGAIRPLPSETSCETYRGLHTPSSGRGGPSQKIPEWTSPAVFQKIILDTVLVSCSCAATPLRRGSRVRTGSRCGGEAVPRRALGVRPTRAAASTAGLLPARLRKAPDGRARRKPPPGHYEPGAPTGRLGTPKVSSKGRPRSGSRRAVVEAAEKRPVRRGRGERTAGTPQAGRPRVFRRPLLAFSQGRSPPRAHARGGSRAPDRPRSPLFWTEPMPHTRRVLQRPPNGRGAGVESPLSAQKSRWRHAPAPSRGHAITRSPSATRPLPFGKRLGARTAVDAVWFKSITPPACVLDAPHPLPPPFVGNGEAPRFRRSGAEEPSGPGRLPQALKFH